MLIVCARDSSNVLHGVKKALRVKRRLRKKPIRRWYAQDPTKRCCRSEQNDVPGKATGLFCAISINGADNATYLMIEEEENGYNKPWYYSSEDPGYRKMPKMDKESRAIGITWSKIVAADL